MATDEKKGTDQTIFAQKLPSAPTHEEQLQSRYSRRFYLFCLALIGLIVLVSALAYSFNRSSRDRRNYEDTAYDSRRISEPEKIFSAVGKPYYLLFYTADCSVCERVKSSVLDYLEKDADYDHAMYLCTVTLTLDPSVTAEEQIGVTDYRELKIAGYPTMFEVKEQKVTAVYEGLQILDAWN